MYATDESSTLESTLFVWILQIKLLNTKDQPNLLI
jgi:hypothetical protein